MQSLWDGSGLFSEAAVLFKVSFIKSIILSKFLLLKVWSQDPASSVSLGGLLETQALGHNPDLESYLLLKLHPGSFVANWFLKVLAYVHCVGWLWSSTSSDLPVNTLLPLQLTLMCMVTFHSLKWSAPTWFPMGLLLLGILLKSNWV